MARDFNGSSQALYSTTIPSTSGTFTWALWAYPDSTTGEQVLFSNGFEGGSSDGYALEIESGNWKFLFSGLLRHDTTTAAASGAWVHLAWTKIAITSDSQLYVNGSASGATTSQGFNAPTTLFSIGAQGTAATPTYQRFFDGKIAEVAFWPVVLTAAEIAELAKGRSPALVRPASGGNYWPTWGRYTTEPDLVGAVGLSVSGSAAAADHKMGQRGLRRRPVSYTAGGGGGGETYPHTLTLLGVG